MTSVPLDRVADLVSHTSDAEDNDKDHSRKGVHESTEDDGKQDGSGVLEEVTYTSVGSVVAANVAIFVVDDCILFVSFTSDLVDEHVSSHIARLVAHDSCFVDTGIRVDPVH